MTNLEDLPDGTVVEWKSLVNGDTYLARIDELRPNMSMRKIVRTFSPDPTPDQEVPREEWASIKPGSRVRIVETNGDEHTVTLSGPQEPNYINSASYGFGGPLVGVARVYLLDEPADPDADLIERMAADLREAWDSCRDWSPAFGADQPVFRDMARAALATVREADQ